MSETMPDWNTADELTVYCGCSYLHHAVRFTFHHEAGTFEAYVDVSLDYEVSFWRRLRVAVRYLLKHVCAYQRGDASEIVVRAQDLPKIRAWVDRAQAEADKRDGAPLSGQ